LTVEEEEEEEEEEEAFWGTEKKAKQSEEKASEAKRGSKSLQLQHPTHQTPDPPFRRFARDVYPPTTH
jgi:hypothetical protein